MREVLILCTGWSENYWETNSMVRYPGRGLETIQYLKEGLPLAGIGVYIKHRDKDLSSNPPCFLIVNEINENDRGELQFSIQFVSKIENLPSHRLLSRIGFQDLFFSMPGEKLLEVLDRLGVRIPSQWRMLVEESLRWRDWIGKHFQEVLKPASNEDYEDRVAEIFRAIGFEVDQFGYRKEGEYPDGIIYAKDFAVVYDYKNRFNYSLDARDKRAMISYVQQARRRIEEQYGIRKVYFAFIAPSYGNVDYLSDIEKDSSTKGALFTSEALLYLLFKKLSMGKSFLLADFEKLVSSQIVTRDAVKKVYGE